MKSTINLHLPKRLVSALAEHNAHINSLRGMVFILAIGLIFSLYALYKAPSEILVRIPPDLSNGAVMKVGDIPKSRVLIDTAFLWVEMNTWLKDGKKDAYANLEAYQHYIGERFNRELRAQYDKLNSDGELDRKRRVTLNPGTMSDFEDRVIVKVNNRAWVVLIDVIVEDFYLDQRVQNVVVRYPLEVEAVETLRNQNPIGLKIMGLASQAIIVKENRL